MKCPKCKSKSKKLEDMKSGGIENYICTNPNCNIFFWKNEDGTIETMEDQKVEKDKTITYHKDSGKTNSTKSNTNPWDIVTPINPPQIPGVSKDPTDFGL
ncbi:MAG: hypothetical protein JW891_15110 [Candidatus Lokiarchaeota archaeon]|nr:hypothetical protein [Candidatus Lokiarchaeota archaeon]MBN2880907.1 hypothetical protein [Candidatus Woesearchaeota archaeon]